MAVYWRQKIRENTKQIGALRLLSLQVEHWKRTRKLNVFWAKAGPDPEQVICAWKRN